MRSVNAFVYKPDLSFATNVRYLQSLSSFFLIFNLQDTSVLMTS